MHARKRQTKSHKPLKTVTCVLTAPNAKKCDAYTWYLTVQATVTSLGRGEEKHIEMPRQSIPRCKNVSCFCNLSFIAYVSDDCVMHSAHITYCSTSQCLHAAQHLDAFACTFQT